MRNAGTIMDTPSSARYCSWCGETLLLLTDFLPEQSKTSVLGPVLCLVNGMPASAPPLGSISQPLLWQKRQQITFAWIVSLIIISRWRLVHDNAGPKRLTLFQIKIYNANTHLQVFVRLECINLLNDLLMCLLLWLFSHEWS